MKFAKITLYVAVQDYMTCVESNVDEASRSDALDYVMPTIENALDDDPEVTLLDYYSDDMRLVPSDRR